MSTEIRNAKIESTHLGVEDHGIFTAWLHLDYGGSGQGFGGYCLDAPVSNNRSFVGRRGTAYGMEFIRRILDALDVESWEKLKGVNCRAKFDAGKVHSIGHFLKDQWFTPESDLQAFKEEAK